VNKLWHDNLLATVSGDGYLRIIDYRKGGGIVYSKCFECPLRCSDSVDDHVLVGCESGAAYLCHLQNNMVQTKNCGLAVKVIPAGPINALSFLPEIRKSKDYCFAVGFENDEGTIAFHQQCSN